MTVAWSDRGRQSPPDGDAQYRDQSTTRTTDRLIQQPSFAPTHALQDTTHGHHASHTHDLFAERDSRDTQPDRYSGDDRTAQPTIRPSAKAARRRPRRSIARRATPLVHRNSGIGASEAAAACGLSPYEQTVELYLQKIGQLPEDDANEVMLFGTCIEAGGIEYWSRLNGRAVTYPLPARRHPQHPFMFATPDAQIDDREGLEFKSMSWQLARQIDTDGLADACPHYVLQAQQQMAVMDWDCVRLVGLVDRQLREWPIERNQRLIDLVIERETLFWEHVQRRVPPAVDFTKAGCLRAVQSLNPSVEDRIVRLQERTSALWDAYEAAGREMTALAERREQYKAAVLAAIGPHAAGLLEDGTRMVRRKLVSRAAYHVAATEYVDVRVVKYDGSPVEADECRTPAVGVPEASCAAC